MTVICLTASIRADGSSRYSKGNKWGYFPSAAFAWRIQQEPFMEGRLIGLDDLKLRVSYGVTGSTAISPYSTQNTLYTGNIVLDKNTIVAYIPNDTYTGSLKWETTAQTDIGIDFMAFHNRLRLTADFYYKKTTDLLNNVEMPRSSGYTTALRNIGSISNKGFEDSARRPYHRQ
jgi:outer membrane receptor protein involved in Fe transport